MKWCYKIFQITVLTIAAALLGWMIVANWQVNLKLHLAISAWIALVYSYCSLVPRLALAAGG